MNKHFEPLQQAHVKPLLAFEVANRRYFESLIAARDEQFFGLAGVSEHIAQQLSLVEEQKAAAFVLFEGKHIIARANIKNIQTDGSQANGSQTNGAQTNGYGEIGYRVAESAAGKGIATICASHLVSTAKHMGLKQLSGFVIANNPASERVLLKNGFCLKAHLPNEFEHKGELLDGYEYTLDLS